MATFMNMSGITHLSSQDMLEAAGQAVDRCLQDDRLYGDLSELLQIPSHNQPSVSGLHDFDYPSLLDPSINLETFPEVSNVKRVPLPPELIEQFGRMQCTCLMGLFPAVERAWLVIDSNIYVWRFEDGGDLAYFDGLSEDILAAGLARPKPGVFHSHVHYLLCLATAAEIILLGVSFTNPAGESLGEGGYGAMHLLPEPLFTVPTDKFIRSIDSTDSGRIFLAGKDGCLYELAYQTGGSWFSKKCHIVNHSSGLISYLMSSIVTFTSDDSLVQICIDNSRNILYTRSDKGTIQVFYLGDDGKSLHRAASMSPQSIVHSAALVARTIDRSSFKPIVHIAALTQSESVYIHLVAVTMSGVRLYFTTYPYNAATLKGGPSLLNLVHVRLPPGYSASSSLQRPGNVHTAYCKRGTLLLTSSQSENSDVMWCISGDSFPFNKQLMEAQTMCAIDGRSWAICELPYPPFGYASESTDIKGALCSDPPVVVSQHVETPRKFIILNAQGTHIIQKLRPVDQLRQLLINCQGPDGEEVKAFFRVHKLEQACATCLVLACSKIHADQQAVNWARMAFFMYGGEAQYNFAGSYGPATMGPSMGHSGMFDPSTTIMYSSDMYPQSNLQTPGPGFNPSQMSTPQSFLSDRSHTMPSAGYQQEVIFSGKHNGICIYLGRILRPMWESLIVNELYEQTPQGTVTHLINAFSTAELSHLLSMVQDLDDFIDFNSKFDSPLATESFSAMDMFVTPRPMAFRPDARHLDEQTRHKLHAEAQRMEKISMQQLQMLVSRVCEVLSLLRMLVEHRFHLLAAPLTKDQQNQLKSITFKQLVINGKDLCSSFITNLVKCYLSDNAMIDSISTRLREVCPSLYSSEAATCSKADELLQMAKLNTNQHEKKQQLNEALHLYMDVAQTLNLPVVCDGFASVRFYEGIVDLCLSASHKRDPQRLALHYYRSGEPVEDSIGNEAFRQRMECYKCVTETLGFLIRQSSAHPNAPSVPKSPGPPPAPDPNMLTNVEAEQFADKVFKMSLKSADELFHISLYQWLIWMNLTEKLLQIQSPYLEPYLKRRTSVPSESVVMMDLLWKHYERTQNFSAAARILSMLAERHGTDVPLYQRVENLCRAIVCAKSSTTTVRTAAEGEFLHELEEKMEVARIQVQVFDAVSQLKMQPLETREALSKLNSDLIDISTLYEEFADRFNLDECKLAIVHCAGLYDSALVEDLWQKVIDKELESATASSLSDKMMTTSTKLIQIGKLYVTSEQYFPVAFIVKYLEQRSSEKHFDVRWTFHTLLEIGVKVQKLHELYDRMFRSKDPYWQIQKKPLHLLEVLHSLLAQFVDSAQHMNAKERRQFVCLSLDSIASYLVELQAMSSTDRPVLLLTKQYKALQSRLERIIG